MPMELMYGRAQITRTNVDGVVDEGASRGLASSLGTVIAGATEGNDCLAVSHIRSLAPHPTGCPYEKY